MSLADAGRSAFEIVGVWSIDLKADEAAIHALAANLGVPARFFTAARLEAETPRLATPSAIVFAETVNQTPLRGHDRTLVPLDGILYSLGICDQDAIRRCCLVFQQGTDTAPVKMQAGVSIPQKSRSVGTTSTWAVMGVTSRPPMRFPLGQYTKNGTR